MGPTITSPISGYFESRTVLGGIPDSFLGLGQHLTFGIQNPMLVMAGVAAVLRVLLERTETGRNRYTIRGNAETAELADIAVRRYALLALGILAACVALEGIVAAANLGAGRPTGCGGDLPAPCVCRDVHRCLDAQAGAV